MRAQLAWSEFQPRVPGACAKWLLTDAVDQKSPPKKASLSSWINIKCLFDTRSYFCVWKRIIVVLFDLPEEVWFGKMEIPAQSVRTALAEENQVKKNVPKLPT